MIYFKLHHIHMKQNTLAIGIGRNVYANENGKHMFANRNDMP